MAPSVAWLRWLRCAALAAVVVALVAGPADGQGTATSSLVATDAADGDYGEIPNRWVAPNGGSAVTIAAGGTISFSYPSGASTHNATFEGRQPVCTQTSGPVSGPVPPLPGVPSAPGWAGTCTFNAAGVYQLVCGLHTDMRATITVPGEPAPPAPPPPPAGTPPPPAAVALPPASQPPPGSPSARVAGAASDLRVASPQRGDRVRGSLQVARPGSRLEVRAFARRARLRAARGDGLVRVGRLQRASVGAGRVAFAVALDAIAKRALRRNGRLAITLRITVTPQSGDAYNATRAVTMRGRASG